VEVPYPVKEPYHNPPNPYQGKVLPNYQVHPPDPLGKTHNFDEFVPLHKDSFLSNPLDLHVLPSQHDDEPPQHNSFYPPVTAFPTIHPHPTPLPTLYPAELEAAASHSQSSPSYSYGPTPGLVSPTPDIFKSPKYHTKLEHEPKPNQYHGPPQYSPLAFALFNKESIRLSRKKRNFVFPGSPGGPPEMARQSDSNSEEDLIKEKLLKEIMKQLLRDVIEKNQELGSVNATIKRSRSIDPISYQFHLDSLNLHDDPSIHPDLPYDHIKDHHHSLPLKPSNDDPQNPLHDLLHEHLNDPHHTLIYNEPNLDLHQEPHFDPHHNPHHALHHDTHQDSFHAPHHHIPHEPKYSPIITTHELPAPPGCRSLATKNSAMRDIKPLIYGTSDLTSSHLV
jgi:hypothetical protein